MRTKSFIVQALLDYTAEAHILIDSGCLNYEIVNNFFMKKHQLSTIDITSWSAHGVTGEEIYIIKIIHTCLDINTHSKKSAHFYVLSDHLDYDLILEMVWMQHHDSWMEAKQR